jgi:hypothetical protein
MLGGLEGLIIFIPIVYLGLYLAAWRYTKKRFP